MARQQKEGKRKNNCALERTFVNKNYNCEKKPENRLARFLSANHADRSAVRLASNSPGEF